ARRSRPAGRSPRPSGRGRALPGRGRRPRGRRGPRPRRPGGRRWARGAQGPTAAAAPQGGRRSWAQPTRRACDAGPMAPSQVPLHRERLWPGPGLWATTVVFALGVGVAVLPADPLAALVGSVAVLVASVVLCLLTAPVVTVEDGELRA